MVSQKMKQIHQIVHKPENCQPGKRVSLCVCVRERERERRKEKRIRHFQDSTFPCAPTDHLTQTINNLKALSREPTFSVYI